MTVTAYCGRRGSVEVCGLGGDAKQTMDRSAGNTEQHRRLARADRPSFRSRRMAEPAAASAARPARRAESRGRSARRTSRVADVMWFPPNRGGFLYASSRSGAAVVS